MPLFVGASESYDTDAWEAYNLKKENTKLRDKLDAAKHDLSLFSERIVELRAENTKLRELVKDALPFFDDDMGFCVGGDCFAIGECCESKSGDDCPAIRRMWERARELGVEVDGWAK